MKYSEQQAVNGHAKKEVITKKTEKQKRFVERVTSFPLVQESVSTMHAYANRSSIGRFALDKANSTLATVSQYTQPPKYVQTYYEQYVQPHLERADALGCRSLDLIQEKFPAVNHSSREILRDIHGRYITEPAQEANKRLASVVDNMEAILERYLPTDDDDDEKKKKRSEETNQAVRAYKLLNDATLRLSQRVSEQTGKLTDPSALVQAASNNLQALQVTLVQYSEAVKNPSIAAQRVTQQLQVTTTERLQLLTQQVSAQVYGIIDYLKAQQHTYYPEWLRARVTSLTDIASKQYELVRTQYNRTDISSYEKAKQVVQRLQDQVLPVLQTIQSQIQYYTDDVKYFCLVKATTTTAPQAQ